MNFCVKKFLVCLLATACLSVVGCGTGCNTMEWALKPWFLFVKFTFVLCSFSFVLCSNYLCFAKTFGFGYLCPVFSWPLFCVTFCSMFSITLFFDQFTFVLWSVCLCFVVSFSPIMVDQVWKTSDLSICVQFIFVLCLVYLCSVFSLPLFCIQLTFVLCQFTFILCQFTFVFCLPLFVFYLLLFCVLFSFVTCFVYLCVQHTFVVSSVYLCSVWMNEPTPRYIPAAFTLWKYSSYVLCSVLHCSGSLPPLFVSPVVCLRYTQCKK